MSKPEKVLYLKYIRQSRYYLEFGMGGSTVLALSYSKTKVYCVESDLQWIRKFRKSWFIRFHLLKRLSICHSNIGVTEEWGYPLNLEQRHNFPNYSSGIFQKIDASKVDLVLIDGRFRVACVLQTILNCFKNKGVKIMIHDFYKRPHYHGVLKYLSEIDKADNLGVFVIRPGINLQDVASDYEAFKFTAE